MTKEQNLPNWNLDDLYGSPEAVEADITRLKTMATELARKYEGEVEGLSGDELGAAIGEYEEISALSQKISAYSFLYFCTDMLDEKIAAFYQNVSEKLNDIFSSMIFFTLAINKIDDAELAKKYQSKKLLKYKPWVEDLRVSKPHQLSDDLEKFDLEKSTTASSGWVRLFDETHATLKYDFRGEQLSNAEIFDKLSNADREVRKDAAASVSKTLGDNIRVFTMITNILAKDKSTEDKWRKYDKPISSRNLSNLVEDEVVDSLIYSVKQAYGRLSHRYYSFKGKLLGLTPMEFYDRNAPLPDADDHYIPYAEAKDIVLKAYQQFSPEIAKIGKMFFDNNWIDVPPKQGKESGAFSHPATVTEHPYILLNYLGKTRDVMTLAHELGHGVHQYLAREQGTLLADTPLTLAETASVFGEQLVFRYMLEQEKDTKKKKLMIAGKVEDMLNTVVRQVAFCEFEREVHDARKNGELSSEDIGKIWMQAQKDSLGLAFTFREDYKYYWSYIPHFIHSPFYVYAYAFGDCLVNSLYAVYLNGMDDFEQKYINMLKSGGSLRHKELLKPFGLDASKPDFWQKGLSIIENFISQLEN